MRASSLNQFIMEILLSENDHQTAQQVYEKIRLRLPAVNPSTVYRALEKLVHSGKISVSDMGTGAQVFECVGTNPHHHLVCQACGSVRALDSETVSTFFKQVESQQDFLVLTNHLVLFGLCERCQKDSP